MAKKPKASGDERPIVTAHASNYALVPGNDTPTYYVNHINIDLSTWDMRFRLGQIQTVKDGVVDVKELASVYMSHGHARAFLTALKTSIEKLEQFNQADDKTKAH